MTLARRRHRTRGMTLVEILAVVVILGLLAGTLIVSFSGSFGKAKHELAKTGVSQLAQKVEAYRIEKGTWPENDLGLKALTDGHATPAASYYVSPEKLIDPWKRSYYFIAPGPGQQPYEIMSYGADGAAGGDGENADVSSAQLEKR